MSFVAIVKTAKDQPLWSGLPDDYPVLCEEFDTEQAAHAKHPGVKVLTNSQYRALSDLYHSNYPAPIEEMTTALAPLIQKRWWQYLLFWRSN